MERYLEERREVAEDQSLIYGLDSLVTKLYWHSFNLLYIIISKTDIFVTSVWGVSKQCVPTHCSLLTVPIFMPCMLMQTASWMHVCSSHSGILCQGQAVHLYCFFRKKGYNSMSDWVTDKSTGRPAPWVWQISLVLLSLVKDHI